MGGEQQGSGCPGGLARCGGGSLIASDEACSESIGNRQLQEVSGVGGQWCLDRAELRKYSGPLEPEGLCPSPQHGAGVEGQGQSQGDGWGGMEWSGPRPEGPGPGPGWCLE